MKFKHTFNVFVNNFSVTYKLLLYRLIVTVVCALIGALAMWPLIAKITDTAQIEAFANAFNTLGRGFADLKLDGIQNGLTQLKDAFGGLSELWESKTGEIVGSAVILVFFYLVRSFLQGFGNYTAAAVINDKMALQANSPFVHTLVKNLGKAALYNLIYIPLVFLYDIVCVAILYALIFVALPSSLALVKIFVFTTALVLLNAIKMTFTTDWLPSLVHGKTTNRKAMAVSFSQKGKHTANVFSNYLVLILVILAGNVAAILFTLGAGFLITMPASYLMLISFELINYCDNNDIKYFTDKNTIVRPETERQPTREEFFRGEE